MEDFKIVADAIVFLAAFVAAVIYLKTTLIHRFWDELDHYHKKKQNSYIDTRVQALIDTGKLKPRLK